ncbi:MAG: branched-chain amino acid ABC transporter [Gammaproteobacteria bacterium]|nr:MAG: branched-chain amino acid ABC transporter [Gammaproteobacteria bacterium]
MDNNIYLVLLVVMVANLLTRLTPMLFFKNNNIPSWVGFIEKNFPPMIMIILIFYTLKDVSVVVAPYGIQELFAIAMTAIIHLIFNNFLLSIFAGTAIYMLLNNL